jgi:hypothetical protein
MLLRINVLQWVHFCSLEIRVRVYYGIDAGGNDIQLAAQVAPATPRLLICWCLTYELVRA